MKSDFERELDDIFANLDEEAETEARLALDIASQFAALRLRRGLSQAQLAEKLGTSHQTVARIENPGHRGHDLGKLKEAVAALGASLDVTLVPNEELEAYRGRDVPKPALETRATEESAPGTETSAVKTALRRVG